MNDLAKHVIVGIMVIMSVVSRSGFAEDNPDPTSPIKTDSSSTTNSPERNSCNCFGYFALDNMTFHEDLAVAGTPVELHYSSLRTTANKPAYTVNVWYGDPGAFPTNLYSASITITILDRKFHHTVVAPFTNSSWTLEWDGRDAAGNLVAGTVPVVIDSSAILVSYYTLDEYEGLIGTGPSISATSTFWSDAGAAAELNAKFVQQNARYGGGVYFISGHYYQSDQLNAFPLIPYYTSRAKKEVRYVGALSMSGAGLGGWSINIHHAYDLQSRLLHEGDGVERKVNLVGAPACEFDFTNSVPTNEFAVLSRDHRQYYVIAPDGRHLRTVDTTTGTNIYLFGYDASNRLATIVDQNSLTTTIVRATNGVAQAIVGPYGLRTALYMDGNGWLNRVVNPAGETNTFQHDASGLLTNIMDARLFSDVISYGTNGVVVSAQDAAGGYDTATLEKSYSYTKVSHALLMGLTNVTTDETLWDKRTRRRVVNAAGALTETITSVDGLTEETSYPNGMKRVTYSAPDPRWGWDDLVSTQSISTAPSGLSRTEEVARAYALFSPSDPLSMLLAFTNRYVVNGRESKVVFTASDRTLKRISPQGRTSTIEFDSAWRPIKVVRPGWADVTANYDAQGRLYSVQQGARTGYLAYTTNGFLSAASNNLNKSVYLRSDAIGRVTNLVLMDNSIVGIRHQPGTGPVGVTPPGKTEHGFGYTPVGLIDRYSAPDVGQPTNMLVTWDPARRVTGITYPDGRTISNVYDSGGLLRSVSWPENRVTNEYGCSCGLLSGVYASNGCSLTYGYDGILLTNVTIVGTISGTVYYAYNNDYKISGVSLAGSNIGYGYEADGLLTNAGDLSLYRDTASGAMVGSLLGNVSETQTITTYGELDTRTSKFGTTSLYSVAHGYDLMGRITQRVEGVLGVTNTYAYGYDNAGRLYEVYTNGGLRARYQYDSNGNRTNSLVQGASKAWQYDAQDRLAGFTSASTQSYQYNAQGQLTNMFGSGAESIARVVVYDTRGSLMEVRQSGNTYAYLLDPMGRRIGKNVNGALSKGWIYQGFLTPVAEVDSNNTVISRFVYATRVNVPDYMVKTGRTYRIVTDYLGSVRLVVDAQSGTVAQRMDYDEWGNVLQDTNPGFQPFGFAGGLYDPDTKLVRFGYRDYDAAVGRWLAKDPILFGGGQENLYQYCHGDPVNYIDSSGLASECGAEYLQNYEYQIEHSWPWQWQDIVLLGADTDIGPNNSNTYEYLGMTLSSSEMGNVGPGWVGAQMTGGIFLNPLGAFVVAGGAFWGEFFTNQSMLWVESNHSVYEGISDALSSWFWNAVGYIHGSVERLVPRSDSCANK